MKKKNTFKVYVLFMILISPSLKASQKFKNQYNNLAIAGASGAAGSLAGAGMFGAGTSMIATGTASTVAGASLSIGGVVIGVVGGVLLAGVGLFIGINEAILHFEKKSGIMNGTSYIGDFTVQFHGESKLFDSCLKTKRRLFPQSRPDLGDFTYKKARGGCIPSEFKGAITLIDKNGIPHEVKSTKDLGILAKSSKRIYSFEIDPDKISKNKIVAIKWKRIDK